MIPVACVLSITQQMMSYLEAQGRTTVRQEARDIFEGRMDKDWSEGRTPLGLQNKSVEAVGSDVGSKKISSSAASNEPRVFYLRALMITGQKCG